MEDFCNVGSVKVGYSIDEVGRGKPRKCIACGLKLPKEDEAIHVETKFRKDFYCFKCALKVAGEIRRLLGYG